MTIIEFFDRTSIENIASALLCSPDKVIFVGDNGKQMQKKIAVYEEVVKSRGLQVEFSYKTASRNHLGQIVEALTDIIEANDDCVLDLDGGEDLALVAVGMVAERYRGKLQLHRFNVRNNTLIDCDADGKVNRTAPAQISVEENVRIYGGRVIYAHEKENTTAVWDFNEEFLEDIRNMWEICKANASLWNTQINAMDKINEFLCEEDTLCITVNKAEAKETLSRRGEKYVFHPGIFKSLCSKGLIHNLSIREEDFSFTYKNDQVKRCLTKAGQILELYITALAKLVKDAEGAPVYNDVMTGVYIDWDGQIQPQENADVTNEIDVTLMKGLVPVFISCKNGYIKTPFSKLCF